MENQAGWVLRTAALAATRAPCTETRGLPALPPQQPLAVTVWQLQSDGRFQLGATNSIGLGSVFPYQALCGLKPCTSLAGGVAESHVPRAPAPAGWGTLEAASRLRAVLGHCGRPSIVEIDKLFRNWDGDASGSLSKAGFGRALAHVGLHVAQADADFIYDSFDTDGSGEVDFAEARRWMIDSGMVHSSEVELGWNTPQSLVRGWTGLLRPEVREAKKEGRAVRKFTHKLGQFIRTNRASRVSRAAARKLELSSAAQRTSQARDRIKQPKGISAARASESPNGCWRRRRWVRPRRFQRDNPAM